MEQTSECRLRAQAQALNSSSLDMVLSGKKKQARQIIRRSRLECSCEAGRVVVPTPAARRSTIAML